jgi:hypothetical protein
MSFNALMFRVNHSVPSAVSHKWFDASDAINLGDVLHEMAKLRVHHGYPSLIESCSASLVSQYDPCWSLSPEIRIGGVAVRPEEILNMLACARNKNISAIIQQTARQITGRHRGLPQVQRQQGLQSVRLLWCVDIEHFYHE